MPASLERFGPRWDRSRIGSAVARPARAVRIALLVGACTLACLWPAATAEGFAVPDFPAREGVPAELAGHFLRELRGVLSDGGQRVTSAPLVTAGIAGSLEPSFGVLVARLDATRYAVLGEFVVRDAVDGPYAVDVLVVDAVDGRASDLLSLPFGLATVDAVAADVGALLLAFTVPVVRLPPGDAGLFVSTEPAGAEVRVDGVVIGRSGALDLLGLAPGRYEVEVRRDGYLPEVRTLDLRAQDTRFLHVVLTEISGGSLQVAARPSAEVWIGGVRLATTPATLTLRAGEHEVELRRAGFVPRSFAVPVRVFRVTRLEADLEPVGEPLIVWSTDGLVRVLVDGRLEPDGYVVAQPGLRTIDVVQGGEVRRWWRAVPEAGVFVLDLGSGELLPLER